MRLKKADISLRTYDGVTRPCVDVKIGHTTDREWDRMARAVSADDPRFTIAWVQEHVSAEKAALWWDFATADAWRTLQDAVTAERIFPQSVTVLGVGRSNGWATLEEFTATDVASWSAPAVGRWWRFAKLAQAIAADVPRQYLSLLFENAYAKEVADERAIRAFCTEM